MNTNAEQALNELYNDNSEDNLFYMPFTTATPPEMPQATSKPKFTQKSNDRPTPPPASPVDRLKGKSDITPIFTGNIEESNTQNRVIPIGAMNSYFYSANMQPRATQEKHDSYLSELQELYARDGTGGLPEKILQETSIKNIYQQWKLSENTLLFADGASGIYKALTIPNQHYFKDFKPIYDDNGTIIKYLIYATLDQLRKCFFGACVDEYGNLKHGTSEILKKSGILKEFVDAIFMATDGKSTGKEPILFMYDNANNFLGYYKPIIFEGFDPYHEAFRVLIDPRFFHLTVEKGYLKIDKGSEGRYIPTIGGLTSISIIGRYYLGQALKNESITIPNSKTATRFIHTIQASLNCQNLLGVKLFPNQNQAKQKVRLNKNALIEMFPSCYKSARNYIDFKKASEQVGLASDILYKGLEAVDGLQELITTPGSDKIYLPSIDRACYFDNQYSKAVFINCETPRQAIENTNKISYYELKRRIKSEVQ